MDGINQLTRNRAGQCLDLRVELSGCCAAPLRPPHIGAAEAGQVGIFVHFFHVRVAGSYNFDFATAVGIGALVPFAGVRSHGLFLLGASGSSQRQCGFLRLPLHRYFCPAPEDKSRNSPYDSTKGFAFRLGCETELSWNETPLLQEGPEF